MDKKKHKDIDPNTSFECFVCKPGSPLSMGVGRALDIDISHGSGIPICFNCGGLGVEFVNDDFRVRRILILDQRKAYFPIDDISDRPFLPVKPLREIVKLVTELYDLYGGGRPCYARDIKNGCLDDRIARHRLEREQEFAALYQQPLSGDPCAALILKAKIAVLRENNAEAEAYFAEAIKRFPKNSDTYIAYAEFLILEKRNRDAAMEQFNKAIEAEPDRSFCYIVAAEALIGASRINEWRRHMARCTACSDFHALEAEDQAAALRAKEELAELDATAEA